MIKLPQFKLIMLSATTPLSEDLMDTVTEEQPLILNQGLSNIPSLLNRNILILSGVLGGISV